MKSRLWSVKVIENGTIWKIAYVSYSPSIITTVLSCIVYDTLIRNLEIFIPTCINPQVSTQYRNVTDRRTDRHNCYISVLTRNNDIILIDRIWLLIGLVSIASRPIYLVSFSQRFLLDVSNYRPISLTSIICKIMESIIRDVIMEDFLIKNSLVTINMALSRADQLSCSC